MIFFAPVVLISSDVPLHVYHGTDRYGMERAARIIGVIDIMGSRPMVIEHGYGPLQRVLGAAVGVVYLYAVCRRMDLLRAMGTTFHWLVLH
jgi:hypothetical protein